MKSQRKLALICGATLCLALGQVNLARADFFFTFDYSNLAGIGQNQGGTIAAQMQITGDWAHGNVAFKILDNANLGVKYNDLNFNDLGTVTSLSAVSVPAGLAATISTPASGNVDGFGSFSHEIYYTDSGNSMPSAANAPITFTLHVGLTAAETTTINGLGTAAAQNDALAQQLIALQNPGPGKDKQTGGNDGGAAMYFGAHIYTANSGNTGWMAGDELNHNHFDPVPVPSSIVMLASLLPGLGIFFYRRRKAAAAA
jgi:hypothetical protein